MVSVIDDGWAEYARKVLEREPAKAEKLPPDRSTRLRHAKGWVDPRVGKPVTVPGEDDPPLTVFRM